MRSRFIALGMAGALALAIPGSPAIGFAVPASPTLGRTIPASPTAGRTIPASPTVGWTSPPTAAPLVRSAESTGDHIVVLRPGTSDGDAARVRALAAAAGGEVRFVYNTALEGFAGTFPSAAIDRLRADRSVSYVEEDSRVHGRTRVHHRPLPNSPMTRVRNPSTARNPTKAKSSTSSAQSPATWGIDRVDQRSPGLDNQYSYDRTGAGVTVYVVDDGIRVDHDEFGGRATIGVDIAGDPMAPWCTFHGTHVAATAGGKTYGIAKGVRLIGVRILNCAGGATAAAAIAGIDWLTEHHQVGTPAIVNASYGGGESPAEQAAVANSIADGIVWVSAAGNTGGGDCLFPAKVPAVIAVGSSDQYDQRDLTSASAPCIDLFAPGDQVVSAGVSSPTATAVLSGTSMASPHVAGAAALYLEGDPSASPAKVSTALITNASVGMLGRIPETVANRLLYAPPDSSAHCSLSSRSVAGTVKGPGLEDVQPASGYFRLSGTVSVSGCLDGPRGADLDLFLERWNGTTWTVVRSGMSTGGDETVSTRVTTGSYRWRVLARNAGASYQLVANFL